MLSALVVWIRYKILFIIRVTFILRRWLGFGIILHLHILIINFDFVFTEKFLPSFSHETSLLTDSRFLFLLLVWLVLQFRGSLSLCFRFSINVILRLFLLLGLGPFLQECLGTCCRSLHFLLFLPALFFLLVCRHFSCEKVFLRTAAFLQLLDE